MTASHRRGAPEPASPRQIADDGSAPAAVRHLYDDIRETLDTSIVNLVFRRLAGIDPEVLAAVWRLLRPAYCSGQIDAFAGTLAQGIGTEVARAAAAQRIVLADASGLPTMQAVIAGYNENNARNLVAFAALLAPAGAALAPMVAVCPAGSPSPGRKAAAMALPPLPAIEALPAGLADLVRRLNRFGDTHEPGNPIASLYLHLTHWPEALGLVEAVLAPLDGDGTLARWRDAVRQRASKIPLPELAAPPDLRRVIEPVLEGLVRCTLPKMIPVGGLLHVLFSPPGQREVT